MSEILSSVEDAEMLAEGMAVYIGILVKNNRFDLIDKFKDDLREKFKTYPVGQLNIMLNAVDLLVRAHKIYGK